LLKIFFCFEAKAANKLHVGSLGTAVLAQMGGTGDVLPGGELSVVGLGMAGRGCS
jgi:hypothetical protein